MIVQGWGLKEKNGQQIGSLEQQNQVWMAQLIQTKMQINFFKLTTGQ